MAHVLRLPDMKVSDENESEPSRRPKNKIMVESRTDTPYKVTCLPSFLLRGIDLKEILTYYRDGKYRDLIPSGKISSRTSLFFHPTAGGTVEDETYVYRDKTDHSRTIVTTNHRIYLAYKKNSLNSEIQICNWCRQPFTGDPVGIPVRMTTHEDGTTIFYIDDPHYKTYECALASLENTISLTRDPLYLNSEQFLRLAHHLQYPARGILRKAPDWRLHKGNGGPLTTEEFETNSSIYLRTNRIIFTPVKIEYQVIPIKTLSNTEK